MQAKSRLNGKEINLTADDMTLASTNFNVSKDGVVEIIDEPSSSATTSNPANFTVRNQDGTRKVEVLPNRMLVLGGSSKAYMWSSNVWAYAGVSSDNDVAKCRMVSAGSDLTFIDCTDGVNISEIKPTGITTPIVTQISLESQKKNFEKLDNGLDIIKNTEIYKYNLKTEEDETKKHIGFVIGDNYNYSEEITSENNDGVDTYSMISVAYKAIQEQQELIEQLQNEIKELKGEK